MRDHQQWYRHREPVPGRDQPGRWDELQLFIQQGNVGDVFVGAAVRQFQNPLTRSLLKLVVHPWYTQGNATLLCYQLPQTWTNVANAWEMSMVQDYVIYSLAGYRRNVPLLPVCVRCPDFCTLRGTPLT